MATKETKQKHICACCENEIGDFSVCPICRWTQIEIPSGTDDAVFNEYNEKLKIHKLQWEAELKKQDQQRKEETASMSARLQEQERERKEIEEEKQRLLEIQRRKIEETNRKKQDEFERSLQQTQALKKEAESRNACLQEQVNNERRKLEEEKQRAMDIESENKENKIRKLSLLSILLSVLTIVTSIIAIIIGR